jgi:hypothetical protein
MSYWQTRAWMLEDRFEMGQAERDRLKTMREATKGQITQRQAGEQLELNGN